MCYINLRFTYLLTYLLFLLLVLLLLVVVVAVMMVRLLGLVYYHKAAGLKTDNRRQITATIDLRTHSVLLSIFCSGGHWSTLWDSVFHGTYTNFSVAWDDENAGQFESSIATILQHVGLLLLMIAIDAAILAGEVFPFIELAARRWEREILWPTDDPTSFVFPCRRRRRR